MRLVSLGTCGILVMIFNGFVGTVQLFLARLLKEKEWPYYRLMVVSFFVTSICIASGLQFSKASVPERHVRKWLLGRGVLGAITFAFVTLALRLGISAGDSAALSSIQAVVAAIVARAFFKEQLEWIQILAAFVCICGATCISKPQFLFGGSAVDADAWLGYSFALMGGFTSAGIALCSRQVPVGISPWWLTLSATSVSALTFLVLPAVGLIDDYLLEPAFESPQEAAGFCILLLFLGTSAMLSYSTGAQWCPPAISATVGTASRLTWGYAGEIVLFGTHPEPLQSCGAALMLLSVVGIVWGRGQSSRDVANKSSGLEVQSFIDSSASGA